MPVLRRDALPPAAHVAVVAGTPLYKEGQPTRPARPCVFTGTWQQTPLHGPRDEEWVQVCRAFSWDSSGVWRTRFLAARTEAPAVVSRWLLKAMYKYRVGKAKRAGVDLTLTAFDWLFLAGQPPTAQSAPERRAYCSSVPLRTVLGTPTHLLTGEESSNTQVWAGLGGQVHPFCSYCVQNSAASLPQG